MALALVSLCAACDDGSEVEEGLQCTDLENICETEGQMRCAERGNGVEICQALAEGCSVWAKVQTCGAHQSCDDGACVCTDDCTAEGASRCEGDRVQVCLQDGEGCLVWMSMRDCAALDPAVDCQDEGELARCDIPGETPCVDVCAYEGLPGCDGDVLQTCVPGDDGCLVWQLEQDCALESLHCGARSGLGWCGTWSWPAKMASLSILVDDSANQTFADGELLWKGSFSYDAATNIASVDPFWSGPFIPLYDDGPFTEGGHEAWGQVSGDGVFSAQVFVDTQEEQYIEYGMTVGERWIWVGSNGMVDLPAGFTGDLRVPGMRIPAFGDQDIKITLDWNNLHPDYTDLLDPSSDAVYIWSSRLLDLYTILWDDGLAGDEAAGDGIYTFVLSEHLGPHDGLLRLWDTFNFGLHFVDPSGTSYHWTDGVSAWSNDGWGAWREQSVGIGFVVVVGDYY